jgi:aminopeptidase N
VRLGRVVAAALVAAGGLLPGACTDGAERAAPSTTTSTTAPIVGAPGARGAGDPYFPDLGNGGYDVEHYDLDLRWDPEHGTIAGTATITATATQDLSTFDLDLSGLEVRSVTVDGAAATAARDGGELVVTPAAAIAGGAAFEAVVRYGGEPTPIHQGTDLFQVGWQTRGREAFVASEPAGASTFFPVNDHPSDKATYSFRITAPSDQVVATNGVTTAQTRNGDGTTTWSSAARDPMASYLVQVAIGDFELVDGGRSAAGVPIRHLLHRGPTLDEQRRAVARTAEMLDVLSGVFGPYPFEVYGVVAVDADLGFALETQTLTLIGADLIAGDPETILVHELAHQWVGDLVTPARWQDIWLSEGFATYSEWLWSERTGGPSAATLARRIGRDGLDPPPADPGPGELFQPTVYERGGLALQALREAVGDDAFFRILRTWVDEHRFGVATTADFEALAARVSGQDLGAVFGRWLHQRRRVPAL